MGHPNQATTQERYRTRLAGAGFVRLQIWVHEDDRQKAIDYIADLREARSDPDASAPRLRCVGCGETFPRNRTGRAAQFCSAKCRTRDYRTRKAGEARK